MRVLLYMHGAVAILRYTLSSVYCACEVFYDDAVARGEGGGPSSEHVLFVCGCMRRKNFALSEQHLCYMRGNVFVVCGATFLFVSVGGDVTGLATRLQ